MKIIITAELEEEDGADPTHEMGLTEEAYERFVPALSALGLYDFEIERG